MISTDSVTTNYIHETAIVRGSIGSDNYVGPYCVIHENVRAGNGNRFEGFVAIGGPPESRRSCGNGIVSIGDDNVFREFSSVHVPIGELTKVGSRCYVMEGAHIAHDCIVEDDVTLCGGVKLAGHVTVMRRANLGMNAVVHQWQVIGSGSMVGMGATVPKRVRIEPGRKYAGNPARALGWNDPKGLNLTEERRRWQRLL